MLAYCKFYHDEIRLIGHVPGNERVVHQLCPECKERMKRIVDEYVERLTNRYQPPQDTEAAGR